MTSLKDLWKVKNLTREQAPLIHSITNPISINACANIVLATGARPIMAEHPLEVEEITKKSQALAINLGNITDARMDSIYRSGCLAKKEAIPSSIDLVGVAASSLRLDYAKNYLIQCQPSLIKGNMSEIKAILQLPSTPLGVDVGTQDEIRPENLSQSLAIARRLAKSSNATVLITGPIDIISTKSTSYLIRNGCPALARVTGTGCMLNCLLASFLPYASPEDAAILACLLLGLAGEEAENAPGPGSFMVDLLDQIYKLDLDILESKSRWEEITYEV